jgi:signal transduction histidine kinase
VNADPVLLDRILEHLVQNALQHTPPGTTVTRSGGTPSRSRLNVRFSLSRIRITIFSPRTVGNVETRKSTSRPSTVT